MRNFERPFTITPEGWLCSASNFGKTRFRRSPTFHLSTSKKNFRQQILKKKIVRKFLVLRTYRRPSLDMWLEVCEYVLFKRWRHSANTYDTWTPEDSVEKMKYHSQQKTKKGSPNLSKILRKSLGALKSVPWEPFWSHFVSLGKHL